MSEAAFDGIDLGQMYREHLLDHYRNPRNQGTLADAEHFHDLNPLCGDEIEMFVRFRDGLLEDIRFRGKGCAVSQASASLLTEAVKGKSRGAIEAMDREKMQELVGIQVTPARARCMMLPLSVLKTITYLHEGKCQEGQEPWN